MVESFRPKPLYGDPCNGCGRCCIIEQCPLSRAVFGQSQRCPALTADGAGGFGCGLTTDAGRWIKDPRFPLDAFHEAAGVMIGAGVGCDAAHGMSDQLARVIRLDALISAIRQARRRLSPAADQAFLAVQAVLERRVAGIRRAPGGAAHG